MIHLKRDDGIEIDIETTNDPKEVDRILSHCLQPEAYAELRRNLADYEEVFFEFPGARKKELPRIRFYLVPLDSRPRGSVNLSTGDFIITFHFHRDHLAEIEKMAKTLKSNFKNANDWQETTEVAIEMDKLFAIPGEDLSKR